MPKGDWVDRQAEQEKQRRLYREGNGPTVVATASAVLRGVLRGTVWLGLLMVGGFAALWLIPKYAPTDIKLECPGHFNVRDEQARRPATLYVSLHLYGPVVGSREENDGTANVEIPNQVYRSLTVSKTLAIHSLHDGRGQVGTYSSLSDAIAIDTAPGVTFEGTCRPKP